MEPTIVEEGKLRMQERALKEFFERLAKVVDQTAVKEVDFVAERAAKAVEDEMKSAVHSSFNPLSKAVKVSAAIVIGTTAIIAVAAIGLSIAFFLWVVAEASFWPILNSFAGEWAWAVLLGLLLLWGIVCFVVGIKVNW